MKIEPLKLAIDFSSSAISHGGFSGNCTAVNDIKVMLQVGTLELNTHRIEAIPAKT